MQVTLTLRKSLYIALGLSLYGVIHAIDSKNIILMILSAINIALFVIVRKTAYW